MVCLQADISCLALRVRARASRARSCIALAPLIRLFCRLMFIGIKSRWWMPFEFHHKSRFPSLHMQVSLEKRGFYILIRYRNTNERQSRTIKTIDLPRLARALLTLIGSCRQRRQRGRVVRAPDLKSVGRGFKSRSDR